MDKTTKMRVLYMYVILLGFFLCVSGEPYLVYLYGNKSHDNLELGIPCRADQIVDREGYAIGFSKHLKQPLWVTYRLTKEEAESGGMERSNSFRSDACILGGSASPSDYLHTSYDRGHLAPAADMRWSKNVMEESFLMSNMSPQTPALNRDVWKRAEMFARQCAINEGSVFVVSGPVITNDNPETIGTNRVVVPDLFYKVIYDETPPEKMVAFIMPNRTDVKGDIWLFATNVVYAEELSGLNFFSALDTNKVQSLKYIFNKEDWVHE